MPEKPNIVFIFSDQHREDAMGCAGNPAVITPNLDRLAAQGVHFTRCYTNAPVCVPARASMMTGQYVSEHGAWFNIAMPDPEGPSHVRNVRDAGYRTGVIGKTHLYKAKKGSKDLRENAPILTAFGFQDQNDVGGLLSLTRTSSLYAEYLKEKGLLDLAEKYMADYWIPWAQGETVPWETPPSPLPFEAHQDGYIGLKAAEWIRNYQDEKPFYYQVLFNGPHDPFDAPDEFLEKYNVEEMPLGIMGETKGPEPPYVSLNYTLFGRGLQDMTEDDMRLFVKLYYAKVTLIDEGIGHIVGALEEKNLLDNTWIIYSSDHGEMLGDHRLTQKLNFYEGSIHIPCIIRPPGGVRGWQSTGLCELIDLTTSIIDMASAEPLSGSEGQSLAQKVLAGPEADGAQEGREVIFSEMIGFSMVRTERYKLAIVTDTAQPVEMYDLMNDPQELNNTVEDPSYEAIRLELLDRYLSRLLKRFDRSKLITIDQVREAPIFKRAEEMRRAKESRT